MSGGDEELAKELGLLSALTIGIGTMIGAGIFVLPGVAAQEAGPIVVVSFVIGGMIAMVNALSVSELGTAMPKAGGGYYYVNRSLGPLFGSIAGLGDWMGLAFASAFYCIGFGQYLVSLLGDVTVNVPGLATIAIIPAIGLGPFELNQIQFGALVAGVIFVGVNYIGAKETGGVQTVIVLILLLILGLFSIAGWFAFDWATLTGSGGLAPMGYAELLPGTALVFVSFLGYAKIATVGEELRNPGRNLPIAIIGSVALVTVIYAVLVTMMLGVVPWPELDLDAPVANAALVAFPTELSIPGIGSVSGIAFVAATLMTLGALLATASSANASILASARINFAMGRDKIVTDWLNEIHPRFATPYRSILVTGGLIILFIVGLGRDLSVLAKAASVLHLVVYALINVGLIVFRETDAPNYDPDFTVPLYPVTPILGAVLSFGLIGFMARIEIALSIAFVLGAIVWYFVYARENTDREGVLSKYVRRRRGDLPDPVVSAISSMNPDGGEYRVLVPLANPDHERDLISLAAAIAKQRGGIVDAVHIVDVPDQTSLELAADHFDEERERSQAILESAANDAEAAGVEVETTTIFSHQSFEEIFDAARTHEADLVVMGWGPDSYGSPGRIEGAFGDLTQTLPCDFVALKPRGFDASHILVPTAGGPSSDLSAEIAKYLQREYDSKITLLHVADDRREGEAFLETWASDHDLSSAAFQVETGDVDTSIARAAADCSLVILGATGRGLLSRMVHGSSVLNVVDEVECSVILAERPTGRSLRERIF